MAVNKVVFGNNTLIDLTSDTIQADKLLEGYTAHDASGANIVGTYQGGTPSGYTVNVIASSQELYGQTIDVYSEGVKLTEIYFSNVGTASIVFQNVGVYEFRVTVSEITYKSTVTVTDNIYTYNTTIRFYPKGSTVTPVNDIQTWLHCADIWDKEYTTLAEVFADNQLLATLMSSENAVNYLVRSKDFIKSKALVPVMTSNTTPEGECSADSVYSGRQPYYAFDGNTSTSWISNDSSGSNCRLIYRFDEAVKVRKASFYATGATINETAYKVQGSNDGTTWSDLISGTFHVNQSPYGVDETVDFLNTNDYEYYGLLFVNANSVSGRSYITELQFYSEDGVTQNQNAMLYIGASDYASDTLLSDTDWCEAIFNSEYSELVLNAKVPVMTSTTTPSGEVTASTQNTSGYDAWKAFNGVDASVGWLGMTLDNEWIQYDFGEGRQIKVVGYDFYKYDSQARSLDINHIYTLQGSDDGINVVDIDIYNATNTRYGQKYSHLVVNNNKYRFTRLALQQGSSSTTLNSASGWHFQFYGRENGGVQTWLRAGGVTDKSYITLAEVLEDTTTLATLMADKDAVDYLVTCKGWATEVCSNQSAMSYIGLNNYASNTLLDDATWCEAIAKSDYREYVLNVKNPNMTSATTPSGNVTRSGVWSTATEGWKAFDGDNSTYWYSEVNTYGYVQYEFDEKIVPKCAVINNYNTAVYKRCSGSLMASVDGITYDTLYTFNDTEDMTSGIAFSDNQTAYKYFKVVPTSYNYVYNVTNNSSTIAEIKIYGREDIPEPTPVQRQTNYYPFSSQTLIGGSNLAYGGVSFSSFKLSGRDLEEIQEIKVKGRLYISRGSTLMKKCRMDYTIAGEKNGKWCFWNGTSWDITDVNITDRYGDGFYDARGWVNIKEINSNVAAVRSELVDFTIPISTIVASAKSNGINLEFANTFLNTAYWYGNFVEILGDSCFSLGIFAGRFANTTNAFTYYGFSVDQVNTTSDDLDTVSELANNPSQVEIVWK